LPRTTGFFTEARLYDSKKEAMRDFDKYRKFCIKHGLTTTAKYRISLLNFWTLLDDVASNHTPVDAITESMKVFTTSVNPSTDSVHTNTRLADENPANSESESDQADAPWLKMPW
jgi:hypothetical protein